MITTLSILVLTVFLWGTVESVAVQRVFLKYFLDDNAMEVNETFPFDSETRCLMRLMIDTSRYTAFRIKNGECQVGKANNLALAVQGVVPTFLGQVWTDHLKLYVGIAPSFDESLVTCALLNGRTPEPRNKTHIYEEMDALVKYDPIGSPWVGLASVVEEIEPMFVWVSNMDFATFLPPYEMITSNTGHCFYYGSDTQQIINTNCLTRTTNSFVCEF